jgi:hypothetical protein
MPNIPLVIILCIYVTQMFANTGILGLTTKLTNQLDNDVSAFNSGVRRATDKSSIIQSNQIFVLGATYVWSRRQLSVTTISKIVMMASVILISIYQLYITIPSIIKLGELRYRIMSNPTFERISIIDVDFVRSNTQWVVMGKSTLNILTYVIVLSTFTLLI